MDDQFGWNVVILGRDLLAYPFPFLTTGQTDPIVGLEDGLSLFQFDRRQMPASSLLGALALFGSLLGDGFLEHLLAQGRRTLVLLLNITQQLPELLLLFLI